MSEQPPPPPENPYGEAPPPPPPPSGGQPASPYGGGQPPYGGGQAPYGGGQAPYGGGQAPPPPPGYGAPPAHQGKYSPSEAISYGWAKFRKNPAELLVPVLVIGLVVIVVSVVVQLLMAATLLGTHDCTRTVFGTQVQTRCSPGLFVQLLGTAIGSLVIGFVAQLLSAGLIKGALDSVDGKKVSFGEMFAGWDKGQVLVAALLVAVGTFIGTFLCYVGAIVFGYLAQYTIYFVVDRKMSAVEALKASFSFTTSHLGDTLVFYLLAIVVVFVGAILCGVGLLVAVPVALLAQAYTFRRLHDQPVVAPPA
jgi:uncharacterized membrane protein